MSSSQIKTYIVTFGSLYNNGVLCKNPVIEPAGGQDIAINCIDPDGCVYKVQVGPNDDEPCLIFIVQCEECDDCGPVIIKKCFCEDQDDCGDCEICGSDGFCEKLCEKCCDGECCDCEVDADCPCNKECVNGSCVCPPGTTENANGCCDECQTAADCPVCHTCVFKDGYKQCVPLDCPCDPDGRCGAKGQCVECLTSSDCDGVNECCVGCECDCCPGYTRINGVCVECDCQTDSDCDICEVCNRCGCRPQACPPGQVPTVINGQCVCVEECDCEDPDCSRRTDFCDPTTVNIDLCGCIPCQGSCSTGCEEPCICDPNINKCVYNPCQGDCVNGTDCPGRDCGCLNGQCVPCFLLDCTQPSSDCEGALGCECTPSDKCGPAGCPPTACSVSADCPFGCTCFEGICVSCDNFACTTDDCTNQPGCACVGGSCEGAEEDCEDTLTMEKDDEECTLTGVLTKQECCQCPALTLDAQGQIAGETETNYSVNFVAELRKGAYGGGPVDNIPKLDNYANADIAHNEPPIAGSVFLVYEVFYDVYELVDGVEVRTGGIETEEISLPPVAFPAYTITETQPISPIATATLNINGVSLPKIGARFESGNIVRYVRNVDIAFFLASNLRFPNKCVYTGNVQFANYSIRTDANYRAFPISTSLYGNARAETITSDVCRDVFFKWYKSDTNSFGTPFRKLYIAPTSGNAMVYEDILTTREQGLESCKYYLLDPDCTCQGPISEYIVFCNPEDINYELRNCNTELRILAPFVPCDPNEDEIFYVEAGSIYKTFTAADFVGKADGEVVFTLTSTTEITEIIYGIVCDEQDLCTKTYEVAELLTPVAVTTRCVDGGAKIQATFTAPDVCGFESITINTPSGNIVLSSGGGGEVVSPKLDPGTYTATIEWSCGCDPEEVTFTDNCCDSFNLSGCGRKCITGAVQGCANDAGVTYYNASGVLLTTPLKDYVASFGVNATVTYTARKGTCAAITRTLAPVSSDCCTNFDMVFTPNPFEPTMGTINVYNGGTFTVTANNAGVVITSLGNGVYSVTGLPLGESVTFTATDTVCGTDTVSVIAGECVMDVDVETDEDTCDVTATVDPVTCECPTPTFKITINNVAVNGLNYEVTWSTDFIPVDAEPATGQTVLRYKDNMGVFQTYPQSGLEHTQIKTNVPKLFTGTPECKATIFSYNVLYDPGDLSYTLSLIIGSDINNPPGPSGSNNSLTVTEGGVDKVITIQNMRVSVGGINLNQTSSFGSATNIYQMSSQDLADLSLPIVYTITTSSGKIYTATFSFNENPLSSTSDAAAFISKNADICGQPTSTGAPVPFEVKASSVVTEDDCKYNASHTFNISQASAGEIQTLTLTPDAGTLYDRDVKFTWKRYQDGSTTLFDLEYIDFDPLQSVVDYELVVDGESFLQQGRGYTIQADCQCSDVTGFIFCCLPDVESYVDGCNDNLNVTLTGVAGSYYVNYGGTEYLVEVDAGSNTGGTAIPGPLLWAVADIYPVGVATCKKTFLIDLETPCTPVVTTENCVGDSFGIRITGCMDSAVVPEDGSYGSIINQGTWWAITNVDRNDPIIFHLADTVNGCISPTYQACNPSGGITTNCYTPQCAPDPTPTPTPSVTPSFGSTPTPTKTSTPTRTPTKSEGATPSVTPTLTSTPDVTPSNTPTPNTTPSNTPSNSPTLTPSNTTGISPTPTASNTPTPSGTPAVSATPSPTATSAVTATPTKTPSETPAVTPSVTPTRSGTPVATPTKTPTRSGTPTPTRTPTGTVAFLLCGGVPYDPDTHQCCNPG